MIEVEKVFATLFATSAAKQGPPYVTTWTVPADLPYFNGHFPDAPIFPAVGILDATLLFLGAIIQKPREEIVRLHSAKFLNPIGPEHTVRIEVKPLGEADWLVEWKDQASEKLLATFRFQV
jgi:3-hydroxymyristoyl/3-hydroxydecanoyl-(acyl carrier protein) dehydratase